MAGPPLRAERALSSAVVEAVASAEGVEPFDLSEPLYDAINPDALDALFAGNDGRVTFEYHGYRVTAHASGEVDVEAVDAG